MGIEHLALLMKALECFGAMNPPSFRKVLILLIPSLAQTPLVKFSEHVETLLPSSDSESFNNFSLPAVYPNPFHNQIEVLAFSKNDTIITLKMHNALGQLVQTFSAHVINGYNKVYLHTLELLPVGFYFLEVPDFENSIQTFKMIRD